MAAEKNLVPSKAPWLRETTKGYFKIKNLIMMGKINEEY